MPTSPDSTGDVLEARYSNHFEVGHNEFEFMFDFGQFHTRDGDNPVSAPVHIVRIVMAPPFALALLSTLQRAVNDHERIHGPIEQS
jgi:hypothetical protein